MLNKVAEKLNEVKEEVYNLSNTLVDANNIISQVIATSNLEQKEECVNILLNVESEVEKINTDIINILALYRPEAIDLREMVSYTKIINDIQRAASNTKNFLLGYEKLISSDLDISYASQEISNLHKSALVAISTAVSMIKEQDKDILENSYNSVSEQENSADEIYENLEIKVFDTMKECNLHKDHFKLLTVVKKLEKITDRAASIAALIVYAESGIQKHIEEDGE